MTRLGAAAALLGVAAAGGPLTAQRVDTVRVGSPSVRAASMPLTSDTVDSYALRAGVRTPVSTTVRTITHEREGPEPVYRIHTLHWAAQGDTSTSTITVRASDLSLVYHRVKASHDSAAVSASRDHLTAWVVLPRQPVLLLDRTLERPVFPVEGQVPWLLPLLPLAPGYRAAIPHFSQWDGREAWMNLEVLADESVTIGARTYRCWKVDTGPLGPPGYRMIRWIDQGSRRVVQSVLRGGGDGPEYWSHLRS